MKALLVLSAIVLMAAGVRAQETKTHATPTEKVYVAIDKNWRLFETAQIRISRNALLGANGLTLGDTSLRITGFTMRFTINGKEEREVSVEGSKITERMKAAIKEIALNTTIYFEAITYRDKHGDIKTAEPLPVSIIE